MKTLIIIMAPPGAGKSELAEYLYKHLNNVVVLNKEKITKEKNKQEYYKIINKALDDNDWVILDSQTVLYQDRLELFSHLQKENLKIIGIWVEVGKSTANKRNSQKDEKNRSTKEEIDTLFKYKISPLPNEPFDDLVYIMRDANIGMSKSYPYMASTFATLDRIINEN